MAKATAIAFATLALSAVAVVGCKKEEAKGKDEWAHGKFVPPKEKEVVKLKPLPKFSCKVLGPLSTWRYNPVVAALADGRVLVAGGRQGKKWLTSSEIYDPATGRSEKAGNLNKERAMHSVLVLADRRVLVFGGGSKELEVFDPKTKAWRVTGRLKDDAVGVAGVQLPDGMVYLAGGDLTDRRALSKNAYLWDPKTGKVKALPELKEGLQGRALVDKEGKVVLVAKLSGEDRAKLKVTDPQQGTLEDYKPQPEAIRIKGMGELGRSKGGEQVIVAYGPDGKVVDPPTGLRGRALLRFFPSRLSWRSLGKLGKDHGPGGAAVALSPDKILVLGGANEVDAVAELCTPGS